MKKVKVLNCTIRIASLLACLGSLFVSCKTDNGLFETVSQKARFAPVPTITISSAMPWYRSVDPVIINLSAPLDGAKIHYSINDSSISKDYAGGFSLFENYSGATALTVRFSHFFFG